MCRYAQTARDGRNRQASDRKAKGRRRQRDNRSGSVNPDRVTGRRSKLRPVKPALSDAEYLRVSSLARTDWWPLIRQAIRVWETADHHGSDVQPE